MSDIVSDVMSNTSLTYLTLYALWPIVLIAIIVPWRVAMVARGEKAANEFPSGTQHGPDTYWRLNRAHANTLENLPIFAALVIVANLTGQAGDIGTLCMVAFYARIAQSAIHVASNAAMVVNLRATALLVQLVCFVMIGLEILC